MKLRATDLVATFRADRPMRLPHFSGSMLRGALGRALRMVGSCPGGSPCAGECVQPRRCVYARLFDPPAPEPAPHRFLRGQSRAPQPLIPLFPRPGARWVGPERPLLLGLRVLGRGEEGERGMQGVMELLVGALRRMEAIPLGREGGHLVFDGAAVRGEPLRAGAEGMLGGRGERGARVRVRVEFVTPAWIERGGRLAEELDFQQLFRAIYRRLTVLSALYGTPEADDEARFQELDRLAAEVRTVRRELRVVRWERHAEARSERHGMQGLVGGMTFEGAVGEFGEVLEMGAMCRVGKATSFGLGRMAVRASL